MTKPATTTGRTGVAPSGDLATRYLVLLRTEAPGLEPGSLPPATVEASGPADAVRVVAACFGCALLTEPQLRATGNPTGWALTCRGRQQGSAVFVLRGVVARLGG